jgi:hypothetical protein
MSENKLFQYLVNFPYFALSHSQRDYILLTEADLRRCTEGTVTVCPANMAIYHTHTKTCETCLFFQTPDSYRMCRKNILVSHDTPTLQRQGDTLLYSFPTPQLVTLRCWKNNIWTTSTASLDINGLAANATGCSITAGAFHTFSELQGSSRTKLDAPRFHLPEKIHVKAFGRLPAVTESEPAVLTQLEDIISKLSAYQQTLDVESLLHVRQNSLQLSQRTHWYLIIVAALCTVTNLGIIYYSFRSCLHSLISHCFIKHVLPSEKIPTIIQLCRPNQRMQISR